MSVVVSKRTPSQFEAIHNIAIMRCEFETLLLRNFGLKNSDEIIRKKYNPTLDDEAKFEYINSQLIGEKKYISDLLRSVAHNITMAQNIHAINIYEYNERRIYQDRAICICSSIKSELQYIMTFYNVDVNKLIPYQDMIDNQINLIKDWRKSDNKLKNRLERQEKHKKNIKSYLHCIKQKFLSFIHFIKSVCSNLVLKVVNFVFKQ